MKLRWWLVLPLGLMVVTSFVVRPAFWPSPLPEETSAESQPPWFEDITDKTRLHFCHHTGPPKNFFMPEIMGSGGALFDFDQDGLLDIYLVQMGGPESSTRNQLFKQCTDHTFVDVSKGSGLDVAGNSTGVAVGDFNNDGMPDVALGQYGAVRLFLNEGKGAFRELTEVGVHNPNWASSLAFFDYDRDGWLDLVVVNYIDYEPTLPCKSPTGAPDYCHPKNFRETVTRLFHNLGSTTSTGVKFEEVTVQAGLARAAGPGLGVLCADFNGDGWPDIFVANDGKPNHLWINHKNGTFVEEATIRGVAYNGMGESQAGMGVAYGDVDGDGLMDLFVTHLKTETHTLWKHGARGLFKDVTGKAGLTLPRWQGTGFGTVFGDFNQDGAIDLAIANGHVARQVAVVASSLGPHWGLYADRNQVFQNDGKGHFQDISEANPAFCATPNVARALAWGDVDGDGALDLLVTTVGNRARLYRNVTPNRGNWLIVRAMLPSLQHPKDTKYDRDAYGAEIKVRAGSRNWIRLINPADSILCSSDPRAHFGLGSVNRIDTIEVLWPDGSRENFSAPGINRQITLRKRYGGK